ncbi:MAG: Ribosomal silencing factor RsfS [Rubritepida sp.]|nr:Ribosomal silencing factor RsfS [Rubritepida sp.]
MRSRSAAPRSSEGEGFAPRGRSSAAPARPRSSAAADGKPVRVRATPAKPAAAKRPAGPAKPRATTATVRAAPKPEPKVFITPKRVAPKRKARAPLDPLRLDRLVEAVRKSLDDDKAEDIVILDVTTRASYADRLIIATGQVDRQIQAMAAHLTAALAEEGMRLRRDSMQSSEDWVLIDAGDLIIHLFKPESRLKFDLEKMWGPDSPLGEAGPGEQSPI